MKLKLTWLLTLFMAFVMQFSFSQEKTVTGTVTTSEDGLPLPGATVVVKGTSRGQQTDFDGKFSIQVNQGDVLVISYVGMKNNEILIGSSSTYNVVLKLDGALDEVVVVGYGRNDSRAKITSAMSLVTTEEINNVAVGNVAQILQGRVAGARINVGSGQPGADPNVTIRGVASISGSGQQPLYVIDGAPVESGVFASLNPNDIEGISVLKDAASLAIYGSRGAAGVIIITTKRGRAGSTLIQYSTQVGFSEPGERQFEMMDSRELLVFQRLVNRGAGAGTGGVPLTDAEIDERSKVNTNWEDEFFRTGVTTTHDLSISGGDEKTQFRTSLGIFSQEGIAVRSKLDRYSGSLNLSHQVNDNLRITTALIGSFSKSAFIDSENSISLQNPFAAVYLAAPYDALRNDDGTYNTGPGLVGPNSFEQLATGDNQIDRVRATYSASIEYDITDFLRARAFGSADFRESVTRSVTDPLSFTGVTTNPGNAGSFRNNYSRGVVLSSTVSLEYHKLFADKHDVSVTGFMEYISDRTQSPFGFGSRVFGLNSNVPPGVAAATISADNLPSVNGTNGTPVNLQSFFATARYGFDDKYVLTLTGRRDASSKFSEANKVGYFWSAGLAWNIDREDFLKNSDFVNSLKLRASAGTVGNQGAIGTFQTRTIFGSGQYNGDVNLFPSSPGNPDLKWETITTYNLGIDFGLWANRIRGSVDVYNRTTSDLFVNQQLSAASGFTSQDINAGELVNKGIELELSVDLINNVESGFRWEVFGNLAYNDNEITSLGQVDEFEQGTSVLREGLPFGTHFIVDWAGVNPANGAPLYRDINGAVTNVFSEDNRMTNQGTYVAPFTGGFGTNISFKGFYINTLFTFEDDYSRFNNQTFFQENPNFGQFNQLDIMNTMWQNPGDITEIQSQEFPRQFTSKDIEDASYLRFRQLEVGYRFPADFLEKTFIKGIRVYAQAVNLWTWTNWTGFDPEDDNNIASYEYPTPRTYTLGLDFTF